MPIEQIIFNGGKRLKVPKEIRAMAGLVIEKMKDNNEFFKLLEELKPEEEKDWQKGSLQPRAPVTIMGGQFESQHGSVWVNCPGSGHVVIERVVVPGVASGGLVAVERKLVKETDLLELKTNAAQQAKDPTTSSQSIKRESTETLVVPLPRVAGPPGGPSFNYRTRVLVLDQLKRFRTGTEEDAPMSGEGSNVGLTNGFPYGGTMAEKRQYVLEGAGSSSSLQEASSSSSVSSSTAVQFMTADGVKTCPLRQMHNRHRKQVRRIKRVKLEEAGAADSVNQA